MFSRTCAAALLILAGCGQVPRPFAPDAKADPNLLLWINDSRGVVVRPVEGLSPEAAAILARAMAQALHEANVPASLFSRNLASYELLGSAIQADANTVAISWQLLTPGGGARAGHLSSLPVTPAGFAAALPRATKAAVEAMLPLVQDAMPQPLARPKVIVAEVAGAPGDGRRSLARALAFALRQSDIDAVDGLDAPEASAGLGEAFIVLGSVAISPGARGDQHIAVAWEVIRSDGSRLGVINQENDVPAGTLDRAWGDVAVAVAEAAAEGVADLFSRLGNVAQRP
ncbi:MAG: hypothetical protein EXQ89_07940 [Rhodospirillaceae bacterium]|nr:hypothetical protein [Rhodospirillaceae bacterium]